MLDELRAALRRSIAPTTLLVGLLEIATGFVATLGVRPSARTSPEFPFYGPYCVTSSSRSSSGSPSRPSPSRASSPSSTNREPASVARSTPSSGVAAATSDATSRRPPPGPWSRSPSSSRSGSCCSSDSSRPAPDSTTTGTRRARASPRDPVDHQLVVVLEGEGTDSTGVSTTYFGEGVLARHTVGDQFSGWTIDRFDGLVHTHRGWIVLPLPAYGMNVASDLDGRVGRAHTNATARLRVSQRSDDRLVLTASGPDAASLSQYAGSDRHDMRNATSGRLSTRNRLPQTDGAPRHARETEPER